MTETQKTLTDLTLLLADVPMDSLTRHWVDCHLHDLEEDAQAGALSEAAREELEDLESELSNIAWRLRRYG